MTFAGSCFDYFNRFTCFTPSNWLSLSLFFHATFTCACFPSFTCVDCFPSFHSLTCFTCFVFPRGDQEEEAENKEKEEEKGSKAKVFFVLQILRSGVETLLDLLEKATGESYLEQIKEAVTNADTATINASIEMLQSHRRTAQRRKKCKSEKRTLCQFQSFLKKNILVSKTLNS